MSIYEQSTSSHNHFRVMCDTDVYLLLCVIQKEKQMGNKSQTDDLPKLQKAVTSH